MQINGHEIGEAVLERIRGRVCEDATLTRTGLSREVAGWLDWRDARGRLKDMGCRVALLKLVRGGVIELPSARPVQFAPVPYELAVEAVAIDTKLELLGQLELVRVSTRALSHI